MPKRPKATPAQNTNTQSKIMLNEFKLRMAAVVNNYKPLFAKQVDRNSLRFWPKASTLRRKTKNWPTHRPTHQPTTNTCQHRPTPTNTCKHMPTPKHHQCDSQSTTSLTLNPATLKVTEVFKRVLSSCFKIFKRLAFEVQVATRLSATRSTKWRFRQHRKRRQRRQRRQRRKPRKPRKRQALMQKQRL